MSDSSMPRITRLNVLKRDGSVQPFDKNKLVNSIRKAGATEQQATLISNRVISRIGDKQTVPSNQLSSMVARSLGRVNPTASGQYTNFRDQKLRSPLASTTKGAAFAKVPSTLRPAALKPAVPTAMKPTSTLPLGATSKPIPISSPIPLVVSAGPPTLEREVGQSAFFQATAAGGTAPYTYQWIEGSTPVGTYAQLSISKSTVGTYSLYCKVTDSTGSTQNSNTVTLTTIPVQLALTLSYSGGESAEHHIGLDERIGIDYGQKKVGTSITLEARLSFQKTGIITYDWFYFSPSGTWPEEFTRREVMENGVNTMLVCLDRPGTYEFKVTWPGDAETSSITSNTVSVTAE